MGIKIVSVREVDDELVEELLNDDLTREDDG